MLGRRTSSHPAPPPGGRRALIITTLVVWLGVFAAYVAWAIASPLWSTPDAPAHDFMAYHVAHGNLIPQKTSVFNAGVTSNAITPAPQGLMASMQSAGCTVFQPDVSADCMAATTDDATLVDYTNPAGRNLPTYYLLTGWPSLFVDVSDSVLANRMAAAAVASLFVAWAASAAWTSRRAGVAVTGVAIACTPMTAYLGGAVNPNTLEITTGMALAACGMVFLREPDTWLGSVMFRRAMIAAALMVTIRMLAPFWVLVWVVVFLLIARRQQWAAVFRPRMLLYAALPVLGALSNVAWTLYSGVTDYQAEPQHHKTLWQAMLASYDFINQTQVSQQIGVFGWLDTQLPPEFYTFYAWGSVFIVGTAWLFLSRREALAVLVVVLASYLLPVALQAMQYNANGNVWQGRYTLPLLVMAPIIATMGAAERLDDYPALRRAIAWGWPIALVLAFSAHVAAFLVVLRRHVGGYKESSYFDGPWFPPLPGELLASVFIGVLAAAYVVIVLGLRRDRAELEPDPKRDLTATPEPLEAAT